MSFPVRLSELTTDWLNEVLHDMVRFRGSRIVGFDAQPVSQRGGSADVFIVTLTYDQPANDAPKRIIAKFSSEHAAVRAAVRDYRLYQREIAFYAGYGTNPGIATPACYASGYNPTDDTCVLLLEYIENARARDIQDGSPEDIEIITRHLAAFHAKWWGREKNLTGIECESSPDFLERRIQKVTRGFGKIDPGFRREFGETACAVLELWLAHARALADYSRQRPLTMCHGSLHRGQVLFPDSDRDALYLIDWQTVSIDSGANDLARIILSGLLPDQRREHENGLLDLYHRLLLEQGVRNYPFGEFLDDYRMGIINLIVFHTQIFADYEVAVVAKYWKGKDSFWEALFQWPGQAAEERGAVEWLRKTIAAFP